MPFRRVAFTDILKKARSQALHSIKFLLILPLYFTDTGLFRLLKPIDGGNAGAFTRMTAKAIPMDWTMTIRLGIGDPFPRSPGQDLL
jgi:hypothetical protein